MAANALSMVVSYGRYQNSRMDSSRIFTLGGGVDHVTRHRHVFCITIDQGQKVKDQGHNFHTVTLWKLWLWPFTLRSR